MSVNTKKTQIVHFRPTSTPRIEHNFTFSGDSITISERHRHFGMVLAKPLAYEKTASTIARSAVKALGLLIGKSKTYGELPYDCFSKPYDSLVQPSYAVYGSAICSLFISVGENTPNTAFQCYMCWTLPNQRQWISVTTC